MEKVTLIYQDNETNNLSSKVIHLKGDFEEKLLKITYEMFISELLNLHETIISFNPCFSWSNLKTGKNSHSFKSVKEAIISFFETQNLYTLVSIQEEY
jgi:hypothetical protein